MINTVKSYCPNIKGNNGTTRLPHIMLSDSGRHVSDPYTNNLKKKKKKKMYILCII